MRRTGSARRARAQNGIGLVRCAELSGGFTDAEVQNAVDQGWAPLDLGKQVYRVETAAIVALLHDVCKADCYTVSYRNRKDDATGMWQKVPYYEFRDRLPYGHGEKSVYIISGYMKLTREEAFAIRYHMGFSGCEDPRSVGAAFEMYPLAFALSVADMEATYFVEGSPQS